MSGSFGFSQKSAAMPEQVGGNHHFHHHHHSQQQMIDYSQEQYHSQEMIMFHQDSQQQQAAAMDDDASQDSSTIAPANDDDDTPTNIAHDSPQAVMEQIEQHSATIIDYLENEVSPVLSASDRLTRRFTLAQSRSFTSIVLVMSFCHSLLRSGRTTTCREVYYYFVTHFRNQRECDAAILDTASLLGVSRSSLGLYASPKGKHA